MTNRIKKARKELADRNVSALLVSDPADIFYLSGFTGSTAYMIITPENAVFFTDGRYEIQSSEEVAPGIEIRTVSDYGAVLSKECGKYPETMLQPSCRVWLADMIRSAGSETLTDRDDFLRVMRMIKDESELAAIKEQYRLAAAAFSASLSGFKTGYSERRWAACLEYDMKLAGAAGTSFDTIVASGVRGALPHGVASDKIIRRDEPVILDFGSRNNYCSDYTRMIYAGSDEEFFRVFETVKCALLKAVDAAVPGIKCSALDAAAREYISSKGYGKYFNHSLGHGVGIDVHELPAISPRSETTVSEGMIFTIEPGIYLPGSFGVRLEETVAIRADGAEVISSGLDRYIYEPSE